MSDINKYLDSTVFGLDIGTRSIVGTIGYMDNNGFHVTAMEVLEHDTRAMVDGQVHDIEKVSSEIRAVTKRLEDKTGMTLSNVCIAAAGRVLKTITVHSEMEMDEEIRITGEDIYNLDLSAVEKAHRTINQNNNDSINYYCVGYTPVKYFLNDYEISNLEGHKGHMISVDLLATFLPEEVIDGLYSAVEGAGLEVCNLTLEPIAAMNVAIPPQYRLLNIALVDVGAGTSDICITKDGSIIAYGMIPSAGDEISEILAKHYLVDFATAEKIKLGAGTKKKTTFKDIMGIKTTVTPEEILDITFPVTDRITKDVAERIIELNGGKPVNAVFVVGGGGKIPGFTKELSKHLSLPEMRVAVKGKEVLADVEFAVSNVKKDSLYVTPIGICINYFSQKNNFIYVTVNGQRIKLYDNSHLTITDALIQAGFPNEDLFPKRGRGIDFTLNGIKRMARGSLGEPAGIYKNGKPASLGTTIEKNDYIDIEASVEGAGAVCRIDELAEFRDTITITVNGNVITCPKYAYVNSVIQPGSYNIQDQDNIIMEDYYTPSQLYSLLDISALDNVMYVNNEPAKDDTRIHNNFVVNIEQPKTSSPDVYDEDALAKEDEVATESTKEQASFTAPNEDIIKTDSSPVKNDSIMITVNGQPVTLSGKSSYRFVDVFDFYPFDLTKAGGTELVTNINGVKADFTQPIFDHTSVDLYWKP